MLRSGSKIDSAPLRVSRHILPPDRSNWGRAFLQRDAMTFEQLWGQLTRKQPKLERDAAIVEFTAGNLRRLLRQAYEQGQLSVPHKTADENPPGAFADIFGGRTHG